MSIAVSAVVLPSRIFWLLRAAMTVVALAVAFIILIGFVGELSLLPRFLLILFALVAAVVLACPLFAPSSVYRIDISGLGQIRIAPGAPISDTHPATLMPDQCSPLTLAEGSLISASLLLLRLQDQSGHVQVLSIFPDSLAPDGFRRLSVACRWIAAQNNRADKIFCD